MLTLEVCDSEPVEQLCGAPMHGGKVCGRKPHRNVRHRSAESAARENARALRWYQTHKNPEQAEQARERVRQFRQDRPEYRKQYYDANAEQAREYSRQYRETHQELHREWERRRRARKRAVPTERIDERVLFVRQEGLCGICTEPLGVDGWHLDHIIPLSKRGWHVYANVQLTHPSCNESKHARCAWASGQVQAVLLATIGRHPRIWSKR